MLKIIEDNPQESRKEWLLWMFERAGKKNFRHDRHSRPDAAGARHGEPHGEAGCRHAERASRPRSPACAAEGRPERAETVAAEGAGGGTGDAGTL